MTTRHMSRGFPETLDLSGTFKCLPDKLPQGEVCLTGTFPGDVFRLQICQAHKCLSNWLQQSEVSCQAHVSGMSLDFKFVRHVERACQTGCHRVKYDCLAHVWGMSLNIEFVRQI